MFGQGPLLLQKYKFFQNVGKNKNSESTRNQRRRIKNVQITCFAEHNVLRQRGLQPISIAVNHCVTLLSDLA